MKHRTLCCLFTSTRIAVSIFSTFSLISQLLHLQRMDFCTHSSPYMGWDRSLSIATCYKLDGLGTESQWGAGFSAPIQTGPAAHSASCTMGTRSFLGEKWPGRGVDHPPPPNAEVKGRAQLYLYSPSGPSWPVLGWTVPLLLPLLQPIKVVARHV
jgi:hypothetical protein